MSLLFYWYPKCSTCRKAKKWLDDQGLTYEEIHIVENTPTCEEIEQIYKNSGFELKKFFNTSGKKYRELGVKDMIGHASESELLDLLASDGMLLKRPIVTDGNKVTVGFKEAEFEEAWKK